MQISIHSFNKFVQQDPKVVVLGFITLAITGKFPNGEEFLTYINGIKLSVSLRTGNPFLDFPSRRRKVEGQRDQFLDVVAPGNAASRRFYTRLITNDARIKPLLDKALPQIRAYIAKRDQSVAA